jgi:hypothetical protein
MSGFVDIILSRLNVAHSIAGDDGEPCGRRFNANAQGKGRPPESTIQERNGVCVSRLE